MRKMILAGAAVLAVAAACAETTMPVETADAVVMTSEVDRGALVAVVDAQPEETKARYQYRNPVETLEFIGIAPGMTVVDVLPGAEAKGWYTPILAGYLGANGADGKLIGVDYAPTMWSNFGFATPEFIEGKKTWATEWVAGADAREAAGDFGDVDVDYAATTFGALDGMRGQADAVLFMRAMHNLSRFNADGGFMDQALADTYNVLKPGGIVGVVQHRAPADSDDAWATGENGYLKQQAVIDAFQAAGFEFVGSSEVNANPLDKPTSEDIVWRLPPSLGTSREDPELRTAMQAIGESDRMTLKFRKPG